MNEKELAKNMEEFFLKETPDDGCMVCRVKHPVVLYSGEEKEVIEYFLITKKEVSNGKMIFINSRFWFDYHFLFEFAWEIIYKHIEG